MLGVCGLRGWGGVGGGRVGGGEGSARPACARPAWTPPRQSSAESWLKMVAPLRQRRGAGGAARPAPRRAAGGQTPGSVLGPLHPRALPPPEQTSPPRQPSPSAARPTAATGGRVHTTDRNAPTRTATARSMRARRAAKIPTPRVFSARETPTRARKSKNPTPHLRVSSGFGSTETPDKTSAHPDTATRPSLHAAPPGVRGVPAVAPPPPARPPPPPPTSGTT